MSGFTISALTMVFALYMPLCLIDMALSCPDLQSFRIPLGSSRKQYHYQSVAALTCPDLQSSFHATILPRAEHCAHAVSVGCHAHNLGEIPGNYVGTGKMPVYLSAFFFGLEHAGAFQTEMKNWSCIFVDHSSVYALPDTLSHHNNAVRDA